MGDAQFRALYYSFASQQVAMGKQKQEVEAGESMRQARVDPLLLSSTYKTLSDDGFHSALPLSLWASPSLGCVGERRAPMFGALRAAPVRGMRGGHRNCKTAARHWPRPECGAGFDRALWGSRQGPCPAVGIDTQKGQKSAPAGPDRCCCCHPLPPPRTCNYFFIFISFWGSC